MDEAGNAATEAEPEVEPEPEPVQVNALNFLLERPRLTAIYCRAAKVIGILLIIAGIISIVSSLYAIHSTIYAHITKGTSLPNYMLMILHGPLAGLTQFVLWGVFLLITAEILRWWTNPNYRPGRLFHHAPRLMMWAAALVAFDAVFSQLARLGSIGTGVRNASFMGIKSPYAYMLFLLNMLLAPLGQVAYAMILAAVAQMLVSLRRWVEETSPEPESAGMSEPEKAEATLSHGS